MTNCCITATFVNNEITADVSPNVFDVAFSGYLPPANENAEENVQSDWNVLDTESDAFIKNKPLIPSDSDDIPEGSLNLFNKIPSGGGIGEFLKKNSANDYDLVWEELSLSPAGSNNQIQWNNNGVLGASSDFTWNDAAKELHIGYDSSNYLSTRVAADGGVTIETNGSDGDYNIDLRNAVDGDFSINNNHFYVDTSTARVGIGTLGPSHALTVAGSGRIMKFGAFEFVVGQNATNTGQGFRVDGANRTIQLLGSGNNSTDDTVFSFLNGSGTGSSAIMSRSSGNDCRQLLLDTTSSNSFNPSSGSVDFASFEIQTRINQTGTASGKTRGFYANQNLTSTADYRAFEANMGTNTGYGFYQSGTSADNKFEGNVDAATFSTGGTAGVSGSFTTSDSKTVTVTNGIITSIT